ncbi:MAG: sigma-70 family RNA polymerase sigma factor [Bacteroidota bacterium]|nr:sigma-70 family RNA polymerase sigma factor [Bacteroidota bacterium]
MEVNAKLTEKAKDDYELVLNALHNGDQKAYASLMSNYRDTIYFMMLKMTNNVNDAEDLTIEAFGKAFKNLHQYRPDYAFSTWLFRIASNNSIDFMRKQNRKPEVVDEDDSEIANAYRLPSQDLDPEEDLLKKERVVQMHYVIDKLKPHYKTLVELRYIKEYSYDEIALIMRLPLGTVKAQLFRARDFLYNIMVK